MGVFDLFWLFVKAGVALALLALIIVLIWGVGLGIWAVIEGSSDALERGKREKREKELFAAEVEKAKREFGIKD